MSALRTSEPSLNPLGKVRTARVPGAYQITGVQGADDQYPFDAANPASADVKATEQNHHGQPNGLENQNCLVQRRVDGERDVVTGSLKGQDKKNGIYQGIREKTCIPNTGRRSPKCLRIPSG